MNLKQLTDSQLFAQTEEAVKVERASTAEVIRLFQEIADRKLYLERGFPSLFEMATKQFGYCAGSAMRRINSMKLMRALPEIEEKIETGELTLTVAANLQSFFQTDARDYSVADKTELVEECLGKSTREVEKELARRNPEREKREFTRHVSEERIRVSFTITEELNAKLEKLKALLSHSNGDFTLEALVERLAEDALEKYDPARKSARATKRSQDRAIANDAEFLKESAASQEMSLVNESLPAQEVRSRYITAADRREVFDAHDGRGCEFVDAETGRRCESPSFLQFDHIEPFARGGSNSADNLRVVCGAHNRMRWQRQIKREATMRPDF